MLEKLKVIMVFTIISVIVSCTASNSPTARSDDAKPDQDIQSTAGGEVDVNQANLSLADYLRRVPGVKVQGSGSNVKVLVRSVSTVSLKTEPLYVIDNVPIGNNYNQVEGMVSVSDIQTVRVLKSGGEAAAYGSRGSNGVILIITKKRN